MRILWISQNPADDMQAVSSVARMNMRAALEQRGHEVRLVMGTRSCDMGRGKDGIDYWPVRSLIDKLRFNARALRSILSTDVDVVVLHQEFQVFVGLVAVSLRPIRAVPPVVVDIRTLPIHGDKKILEKIRWLRFRWSVKAASRHLDGLTTITPELTDYLVRQHLLKPNKLLGEWSSAVSPTLESESPPSHISSDIADLPRPVGAYLGVFSRDRGLEQLIVATQLPDFCGSLVMVGCGPIEGELESLRGAHSPNVFFTGKLPQAQAWAVLSTCDYGICLLADRLSWQVSSPLKVLEYMAAGLPIMASESIHRPLLGDDSGALLLETITPEAISAASAGMLLLEIDAERRHDLLNRYSWDNVAGDFLSALEKAAGPRRTSTSGGAHD